MNIIDFLSVFPYYVDLGLSSSDSSKLSVIRIVRLFRIFRILKFGKYSETAGVILIALKRSKDGFTILLFCLAFVMVLFSTGIFYAEQIGETFDPVNQVWIRNTDGSISPFQSVISTFWWCIITVTTVGYGDTYPVTWLGKMIAGTAAITGILVLVFPVTIFGSNFSSAWQEYETTKKLQNHPEVLATTVGFTQLAEIVEQRQLELDCKIQAMQEKVEMVTTASKQLMILTSELKKRAAELGAAERNKKEVV